MTIEQFKFKFKFKVGDYVYFIAENKLCKGVITRLPEIIPPNRFYLVEHGDIYNICRAVRLECSLFPSKAALIAALEAQDV